MTYTKQKINGTLANGKRKVGVLDLKTNTINWGIFNKPEPLELVKSRGIINYYEKY